MTTFPDRSGSGSSFPLSRERPVMKHVILPALFFATMVILAPEPCAAQELQQDRLTLPLPPTPGAQSPTLPVPPPPPGTTPSVGLPLPPAPLRIPLPPQPPYNPGWWGSSCGSTGGSFRPGGMWITSGHSWGHRWGHRYALGPALQHRYIALTATSDRIATLATMDNTQVYVSDEPLDSGQQRVSTTTRSRRAMSSRNVNPTLASEFFGVGFDAYWKADYSKALTYLNHGLQASDRDARLWYYKGFAEIELGRQHEALASLAEAVRVQLAHPTQNRRVSRALERIQGDARVRLEEARLQAQSMLRMAAAQRSGDDLASRQ